LWVVIKAIKSRKFIWLAIQLAKRLSLNIQVDPKAKTWKIVSKRMFAPEFQRHTYEDIASIFKSKPETFKVKEERTPEGKFKSFVVEST